MERNYKKLIVLFVASFFFSVTLFGQDSSSVFPWKVISKRIEKGKYLLVFSTPLSDPWELYSPNQKIDIQTAELQFKDSSITQAGGFLEKGETKEIANPAIVEGPLLTYQSPAEWTATIEFKIKDSVPALLQGTLLYTYGKSSDTAYLPSTPFSFTVNMEGGLASRVRIEIPSIDIKHPARNCGDDDTQGKGLFSIFLLGLVGGLIALLTPCVFPMIPLTVSFFTKQQQSKRKGVFYALLYGFFIFLIYVLLSLPFHIFNASPQVLNNISTNAWLNLFFFVIFLVFAISFFGYFEITLPGGLANRAGTRSGIDSIAGIFFMAFTLAIVSFSCTGPILGSLLVSAISSNSGPIELSFGMGGFGMGLALPFAVFAFFPNWLQSIPKSGGWLNTVKVLLGFLEVAMAVKFLSNADLVMQWGIIKREIFMAIWSLVGISIVLYLFGKIRFPHDSPLKRFSARRIAAIIVFSVATLYLLPGVTNTKWANLKLISGFPPPLCYSVYGNPVNCKRGFAPMRDYEDALKRARKENKPVLIDFTGWACVNCRRMEESVWTDPVVDSLMRDQFVVVSLYVDEKTHLPVSDQTVYHSSTGEDISIVSIGDKWSNFQIKNFHRASQPQYAIISTDEKALTKTKTYTPDPEEFAAWLECGLDAFKEPAKQAKLQPRGKDQQ